MKVKYEREVAQSCLTLHDPMDCSLLGSSVHGIFQARVLEWGAIAFSETGTSRSISFEAGKRLGREQKWVNTAESKESGRKGIPIYVAEVDRYCFLSDKT